jgi:uncharacterized protein YjdB
MRKMAVHAFVLKMVMLVSLVASMIPLQAVAAEADPVATEMVTDNVADPDPVPVGYLIEEDFSFPYTRDSGELRVSGWDIRRAGGNASFAGYSWFKLSDSSTVLPVSMNRQFVAQSAGTVTLEYRFKPAAAMDGTKWLLRNDNTDAINVSLKNGNIVWEGGGGLTTVLQPYSVNTEYGVKIVADIDADLADVYINGALRASGAAFKQAVALLDNFQVQTGDSSTGDLFFSPVKLHKGYIVNEKFVALLPGFMPQDWQANAEGGVIAVQQMVSTVKPDIYSLKLDAAGATGTMSFAKNIPAQTGNLVLEYNVLIPQKKDGLTAELTSGGSTVLKLTTSNGQLGYENGSAQFVPIYDYVPNLWYKIKVTLNRAAETMDVYINSKLKAQAVSIPAPAGPLDGIRYTVSSDSNGGVMWLDDIAIYPDLPLPADYVPAPVAPADSGDHLVGMQTCPLWREGHHYGWDPINPYTERTPYLGFYDEGNSETADWEIKWMVEHGVDFQLACWFKPQGGAGNPIKDPWLGNAINDGYLNSQYGDQMKFAIVWENAVSNLSGSSDFRNNLVPYWIETYFKDPRYMKIDNKPVLSIYALSGLLQDFGGTLAGVKAELDYLRSAVQLAGFDDIVLLTTYNGTNPQAISDRKAAGFDAIYAYSWGYSSGHEEFQKERMTQRASSGSIDMLPTISMGRDDLPWGLSPGYIAPPSEFQSVAEWVKDSHIPSLPTGSLGKRVIMVDNWNEYGEGHFLMPAGLAGFGYLDAIRNVFTDGGTHMDAAPTQAQKDRIGVLYPADRVSPFRVPVAPPMTNDYQKLWSFNSDGDSEGWSLIKQIDPLIVEDGAYTGTAVGNDPGILSEDDLGIEAVDVPYVKIRMKSSVAAGGQFFFITDQDPVWDESKSAHIFVEHKEGDYIDYVLGLYNNKKWTGKIKQLRFDPIDTAGQFAIDEIGMVLSPVTGIKLYVNELLNRYNDAPQTVDGVPMVPGVEVLKKVGAVTEWDADNQELIAVKDNNVYRLHVGQTNATADGETIVLDHVPVALANGTVMIPASFFTQAFGYEVVWDATAGSISLSTNQKINWEFNGGGSEGWTANGHITGLQTANGELSGTSIGTDPHIISPNLYYDASKIKGIRIKYRNETSATKAVLYFTTVNSPGWAETRRFVIDIVPNDTTSREYVIDVSDSAAWSGSIDQLRFDPTGETGTFAIDYIRLDTSSTVNVTGIGLSKSALQLEVDQSETLTATVVPANATNKGVVWSSDNSDVASVDTTGVVVARKTGIANITATTADGGLKASALVTVPLNATNPTTPPESTGGANPVQPSDPKKMILSAVDDLVVLQGEDGRSTAVIKLADGVEELVIPAQTAVALGDKDVQVESGELILTVPAAVIKQLAELPEGVSLAHMALKIIKNDGITTEGLYRATGATYALEWNVTDQQGHTNQISTFAKPILMKISYDSSLNINLLGIYYWNKENENWEYMGGSLDADNKTLEAELHHFSTFAVLEYTHSFLDVANGHWAYEAVQSLAAKQIIKGKTVERYDPAAAVTRAEFAALLVRTLNLMEAPVDAPFSDVATDAWYAGAVAAAYAAKLVQGKSADIFAPDDKISREEMAVMLIRAYTLATDGQVSGTLSNVKLGDLQAISPWAKADVEQALSIGMLQGMNGGEFQPQRIVTRAQSAQAIFNVWTQLYHRES